jgi:hypothetical protein
MIAAADGFGVFVGAIPPEHEVSKKASGSKSAQSFFIVTASLFV